MTAASQLILLVSAGLVAATSGAWCQTTGTGVRPAWLAWKPADRTLRVQITAGSTSENSGWNFNGYARGELTIVVPRGASVTIDFSVADPRVPHSVGVVEPLPKIPSSGDAVRFAFPNAFSTPYVRGMSRGGAQQFQFVADRAGRFWMFCGVPPHGAGGMWVHFVVSATATEPRAEVAVR